MIPETEIGRLSAMQRDRAAIYSTEKCYSSIVLRSSVQVCDT